MVLEAIGGPDTHERQDHHERRDDDGLDRLKGTLQPQRHGQATVTSLISAEFHRVLSCHGVPHSPGRRPQIPPIPSTLPHLCRISERRSLTFNPRKRNAPAHPPSRRRINERASGKTREQVQEDRRKTSQK
ncbi:hypothetical protein GCM10023063_32840 [Arthrobacter methylotrophus]